MENQSLPLAAGPSGPPPFAPPAYVAPARQKTRLRDILFGWRSAVALFCAGVVLGGVAGAGVMAIVDHHGGDSGGSGFTQPTQPQDGFGYGRGSYGQPDSGGSDGSSGSSGSTEGDLGGTFS